VRALLPAQPDLEVHTRVQCAFTVPEGATLVLAPRATDADWLNIQRPVFARRALRVILWCDAETTLALKRDAVDFFDWISHRHECPPSVAAHAVAGIRGALAARAAGIAWTGGDLDACFHAALPGRELVRVSAAQRYGDLVDAVRAAGPRWVGWTGVEGMYPLRRVRWALAEAGRWTRTVLIEPKVPAPGWWPVHGRWMPLAEARERLEMAGASAPGRLAALVGLEPEAVEIAAELLARGMGERDLEAALREAVDPGAALVGLGEGLGFATDPPVVRATRGRGLKGTLNDYGAEGLLWSRSNEDWKTLAEKAMAAGDGEVAGRWARRAIEQRGSAPEVLMIAGEASGIEGHFDEAITYFERAAGLADPATSTLARARASLGVMLAYRGQIAEAEIMARSAVDAARSVGAGDSDYANTLYHLGKVLADAGAYAAAENFLREAVELTKRMFDANHPKTARVYQALGEVLGDQGSYGEAEGLLRRALTIYRSVSSELGSDFAFATRSLGTVLAYQGKYEEAEELLRDAVRIESTIFDRETPARAYSLQVLADVLIRRGRPAEAIELLDEALRLAKNSGDHAAVGESMAICALAELHQGKYAESEATAREALIRLEQTFGTEHRKLCDALQCLANAVAACGRAEEALPLLERALRIARSGSGAAHLTTVDLLGNYAAIQSLAHDERAPVTAREAFDAAKAIHGTGHPLAQEIAAKMLPIGLASWLGDDLRAFREGDKLAAVDRVATLVQDVEDMGFERAAIAARSPLVAMLSSLGRTEEATSHARRGLALAEKAGEEKAAQHFRELLGALSAR
jgi:tetratricopeptide (TPR) repeat protein